MKEKLTIKNRKEQRIVVVVNRQKPQKGLAFVMHGLSGNKDQAHIQTFASAFEEHGITTVLFDTTNTFGESEGKYEDATVTNYFEDLEDVIGWARKEPWFEEPFYLTGHSLGGICTVLYSEKHPERVKGLAPISTVISGKLSLEVPKHRDVAEEWKRTGWDTEVGHGGRVKRLKWSHMEDRVKYDVLPDAHKLTMPVLLIVGDKDDSTPPEHQKMLYDVLPGEKEFHIIKGSPHTFREPEHLEQVREFFDQWIEKRS